MADSKDGPPDEPRAELPLGAEEGLMGSEPDEGESVYAFLRRLPMTLPVMLMSAAPPALGPGCQATTESCLRPESAPPPAGASVVYVDGVFDLFHPGHIAFLKKARAAGGAGARLIAGVITDEDAQWKRRPVMSHAERVEMVRHCSEVDEVVERPPLYLTEAFLAERGIDLVVHGDDSLQSEFFRVPIERGIMRYVPYTATISTSALIERVVARHAASPKNEGSSAGEL